jgi:ring-1,2-phenylacetyl-CoA epoxidase subunit PaaC
MSDEWPPEAVDLLQSIADTKLLLSQRYAEWMLSGPVLEDDIAGASASQDEIGHVRQLFRLLTQQGRDQSWLEGDRNLGDFCNAATLDDAPEGWVNFVVAMDVTERAAWYLLDAVAHDDFTGLGERIGHDEYFHLEHIDGRIETLSADRPADVAEAFERYLPDALAFIGPSTFDDDSDPLLEAGFTDRSVAELRAAYREKYEEMLADTEVSLDGVDWDAPDPDAWDATRRRVGEGTIDQETLDSLTGAESREFAIE